MPVEVCPKCAYVIPPDRQGTSDCPSCGIVFAKYDPDAVSMRPMVAVSQPEEPKGPPVVWLALALGIALAAVFILGPGGGEAPDSSVRVEDDGADLVGVAAADDDDSGPSPGLTAADLRAQPGLDRFGEIDPDRAPTVLTDGQIEDARAALQAEAEKLRVTFEPMDQGAATFEDGPGESALREDAAASDSGAASGPSDELAFVGWYEGAEGHARATRQASRMGRPMVVYFHTDWCGYCKRFDADFLPDPLVRRFLSNVIRVHINPEAGDDEMAIARRYGVRGYPSFFVQPGASDPTTAQRVHPFRNGGTITAQQFAAECEEAAGG